MQWLESLQPQNLPLPLKILMTIGLVGNLWEMIRNPSRKQLPERNV